MENTKRKEQTANGCMDIGLKKMKMLNRAGVSGHQFLVSLFACEGIYVDVDVDVNFDLGEDVHVE